MDGAPQKANPNSCSLEAVLDRSEVLGKEFADLNSGFLYDAEIAELNRQRELPMNVLYHRLAKLK